MIRLLNWEYWPIYVVNIPVVMIWLYFGVRARSLFFFSAANPAIKTGGMFGESKNYILKLIPGRYLPLTLFIPKDTPLSTIIKEIANKKLQFPLIAKPDVGERGFLVSKIENEAELSHYVNVYSLDFILQEFISMPEEVSVMYHRMPDGSPGKVTSLCVKKMLQVNGDGQSTIAELMSRQPRARLQLERFRREQPALLAQRPANGQPVALEPIGNHSRGTMFLNGNKYIDDKLETVFDEIGQQMQGLYYGRFDMKCESIESLKQGRGFKILEFNGVASEPAHIYDPAYPLWKKYRDIYRHWRIIYQISLQQRERQGIRGMSLSEAKRELLKYVGYMRKAKG